MVAFFLDSSAMVKRFSKEKGTSWVLGLFRSSSLSSIYISRITPVETAAGLAKQNRIGILTIAELDRSIKRLARCNEFRFIFAEVNQTVMESATLMALRHGLRGFDAVQLATAIEVEKQRSFLGASPLTFVSADNHLNLAAESEKLNVEDPSLH